MSTSPQTTTVEAMKNAGAADGGQNLPSTTQTVPTTHEQKVIDDFDNAINELVAQYTKKVNGIATEARSLSAEPGENDFKAVETQAKSKVTLALQEHRSAYRDATEAHLMKLAVWKHFRFENGLTRPAKYPPSHFVHIAAIALMLIAEALLNSTLLADNNALGLVGGFSFAIMISLLSVGTGFLAGRYAGPRLECKNTSERSRAIIAIVLWATVIFGFQLLFAHYRDLASSSSTAVKAGKEALHHLRTKPFALQFNGVLLFALGCLFSGVAFIDGMLWDDRYLGYGEIDRDMERAKERHAEVKNKIESAVRSAVLTAREGAERIRIDAERDANRLVELSALCNPLAKQFAADRDRATDQCQQLLQSYRQANEAVRTTRAPQYFETMPNSEASIDLSAFEEIEAKSRAASAGLPRVAQLEVASKNRETERLSEALKEMESALKQIEKEANASPKLEPFASNTTAATASVGSTS